MSNELSELETGQQQNQLFEDIQTEMHKRDEELEMARAEALRLTNQIEQLQAAADYSEQLQQELESIQSSFFYHLYSRFIWALTSKFVPAPVRKASKSTLRFSKRLLLRNSAHQHQLTLSETEIATHDASVIVEEVRQLTAPIKLDISDRLPRRVNIIISTVNFKYLFAGYMSVFHLALQLKRNGYLVRIVIVDHTEYNPSLWRNQITKYDGLQDLFDQVQFAYAFDRSIPLDVSPNDAFIATSTWTAHVAHHTSRALGQEKFVFLTQECETMFFPTGSAYALAEEAYRLPYYAIFSTEILREYFKQNKLGIFSQEDAQGEMNSVAIQNATIPFPVTEEEISQRKRKRLLFYARADSHATRNMFELGVLALREVLKEGHFDLSNWEFHGLGSSDRYKNLELYENTKLKMLPKVNLQEYTKLLPSYDLGLSLMLSPHPSMVPLDMASAALVTVTNTYANKTSEKMSQISSNIIAIPPTIEGIKTGLIRALGEVDNYEKRIAGSRLKWPTSWVDTFNAEVMNKLKRFIG